MIIKETKFEGVYILEPKIFEDSRGFFMESYNQQIMNEYGLTSNFVQDNHSFSVESGIIRGLHYQLNPKAQTKLIRTLSGAIYDVVVDIRRNSSTYGEWVGIIVSEENRRQVLIPKGFAHGFCTITKNTQVFYKVDTYYSPENDRGILWSDPELGIDWPTSNPVLSAKDMEHPMLSAAEINFN